MCDIPPSLVHSYKTTAEWPAIERQLKQEYNMAMCSQAVVHDQLANLRNADHRERVDRRHRISRERVEAAAIIFDLTESEIATVAAVAMLEDRVMEP